ncbi:carboxylesterase/lipase family protein [Smaragdicoccus niigatensis]|uniref:carboxylesterase/lipase family protein n=1 Tax=Smaragdicoccus niigatensis TaxID=359359 RepID=UPI0003A40F3A|nr:carboxylesterase/lipase family protein [Smaragdicoccus niigatensis]
MKVSPAKVTVATAEGVVAGVRSKRRNHRGTVSWKGIPFAAPPIGENRFRAPQPVKPWTGILDCSDFGNAGIQSKRLARVSPTRVHPTSEDCLTLNVFAPEGTRAADDKPVMVFIHGGGHIFGTTATPLFDGSLLARAQNVVVVTIQYRFGPFGFLDFSSYSADNAFVSNAGMRDQVEALRWVQRNIAAFGGDPDNVTIFGESAGATDVLALLSAPAAHGLFARAIAESPASEMIVSKKNAAVYADEFLRILRDPTHQPFVSSGREKSTISPEEAQKLLAEASSAEVLAAGARLMSFMRDAPAPDWNPFAPQVDGDCLPATLIQAAQTQRTAPVPLIIGTNSHEGTIFSRFWDILPGADRVLRGISDPERRDALSALYDGGAEGRVQLSADGSFLEPATVFAEGHSSHAPTFVYRFDYHPPLFRKSKLGAAHGTELFAVFGTYQTRIGAALAAGDRQSAKRITTQVQQKWGDFARGGQPGAYWPSYKVRERNVLVIDHITRVESDPEAERRRAWNMARSG